MMKGVNGSSGFCGFSPLLPGESLELLSGLSSPSLLLSPPLGSPFDGFSDEAPQSLGALPSLSPVDVSAGTTWSQPFFQT